MKGGVLRIWAPFGASRQNRAIRCNLFYRSAVKKDFRFYPWRMGEQQSCLQDCDQPWRMGGRPFCFTNTGLRPRPACTALKKIATSRTMAEWAKFRLLMRAFSCTKADIYSEP
jgi:hypothetical protein